LFNRTDWGSPITVHWKAMGLADGKANVRDLWLHKDLGEFNNSFKSYVPSHGVVMIKVTSSNP